MELEDQLVCRDLSEKLRWVGYPHEGLWWWEELIVKGKSTIELVCEDNKTVIDIPQQKKFVAPTVAELGERLPECIKSWKNKQAWICDTQANEVISTIIQTANTEANARAKMYIFLAEKGLLKGQNEKK